MRVQVERFIFGHVEVKFPGAVHVQNQKSGLDLSVLGGYIHLHLFVYGEYVKDVTQYYIFIVPLV